MEINRFAQAHVSRRLEDDPVRRYPLQTVMDQVARESRLQLRLKTKGPQPSPMGKTPCTPYETREDETRIAGTVSRRDTVNLKNPNTFPGILRHRSGLYGAPARNRTANLPLTRRVLCQLSYRSIA